MSDSLLNNTINKTLATGPTIAKGVGDFWGNLGSFGKLIFILITVIIFVIIINLGIYLITYWGTGSQNIPVYLTNGVSSGYTANAIKQNPKTNPDTFVSRSNNRIGGTEYTWSIWLNVKDIVSNGKPDTFQNIFNKGNNQYDPITGIATINNAPGLYLSKETNTLRVIMDTIAPNPKVGNNYTDITNIPLGKWFHLAIRLQDRNLDTYVNGIIATRLYLIDVPKQNFDTIYVCQNGGFSGNYSDLFYYNYALPVYKLQSLVADGPGLNYSKVHIQSETSTLARSSTDNYLSPLWYFGENSSQFDVSYNSINKKEAPAAATPPAPASASGTGTATTPTLEKEPDNVKAVELEKEIATNIGYVPDYLATNFDASGDLINTTKTAPIIDLKSDSYTATPTIATIIYAFAAALSSLYTTITDMLDGDVRALDQQSIDCAGNVINSYQYINIGDGTFNYNYTCGVSNGSTLPEVKPYSSQFSDTAGTTLDLANQTVQCPTKSVLSQFQLANNTPLGSEATATQLQYKYKCVDTANNLSCRTLTTPSYKTSKNIKSLSNANITCNGNEALSGFKYILSEDSKQFHYEYTCCSATA